MTAHMESGGALSSRHYKRALVLWQCHSLCMGVARLLLGCAADHD